MHVWSSRGTIDHASGIRQVVRRAYVKKILPTQRISSDLSPSSTLAPTETADARLVDSLHLVQHTCYTLLKQTNLTLLPFHQPTVHPIDLSTPLDRHTPSIIPIIQPLSAVLHTDPQRDARHVLFVSQEEFDQHQAALSQQSLFIHSQAQRQMYHA